MIYKNFYAELGKLLYAVAKSDGKVAEKERKAMHEKVVKDLVPVENSTDEFGTDSAFYVEMQFESCQEQSADPETCFIDFISYVDDHHSAFDAKLRRATVEIADAVAGAFYNTNSKERDMLERLKHKIQEFEKQQ
ncbi:hypothetical protein [Salibacter sp.]|uniref:tellurite resistance TerB family protein n=1 Tax=Salibacter sp. TaxID=2010995 RepID=UPI00286FE6CE|nr:hypothetical protein [Salibacter sp.]MDR9487491.1 hypothetical protein [Salibacter sp.]